MQYQIRQQVIEPIRPTFTPLINRYGGRSATRYEEGSVDIQATENFHYRPLWDPQHELYDPNYSVLRLSDPYSFTDPRQLYYAPYVTSRAQLHDAFLKTLDYINKRDLLARLPQDWHAALAEVILPLRHYECAAELVSVNGGHDSNAPFGGYKRSGNGREWGDYAFVEFMEIKSIPGYTPKAAE